MCIRDRFGSKYFIWNVGEHPYDTTPFNSQVVDMCIIGYPCLPLDIIFSVCKSMIEWLMLDKKNVAIVHCQQAKGRSALVIISLICLLQVYGHPSEALVHLCEVKLFFDDDKCVSEKRPE
eukprot:TRINITY_DN7579_c0_g1_i2.p1 TRINITY_DN7579_c0_g1~~TRINITY_DN7579_c0_g1_i2.p1  ORF type:complete len:133 (-),score=5.30 TRINITY_DN7579_c0_g1_i2:118-477(-)